MKRVRRPKEVQPPLEIERKWIADIINRNVHFVGSESELYKIHQGYISGVRYREQLLHSMTLDPKYCVNQAPPKYFQTIKVGTGLIKEEYEIALTKKQFDYMWPSTENCRLEKWREKILYNGKIVELDEIILKDRTRLRLIEIEFSSEEEANRFNVPDFFGKEVTEDERYSNYHIAKYGKIF
jgi:CYTH domain-containing protein